MLWKMDQIHCSQSHLDDGRILLTWRRKPPPSLPVTTRAFIKAGHELGEELKIEDHMLVIQWRKKEPCFPGLQASIRMSVTALLAAAYIAFLFSVIISGRWGAKILLQHKLVSFSFWVVTSCFFVVVLERSILKS